MKRKSRKSIYHLPEPIIREENGEYKADFKYFKKDGRQGNNSTGRFPTRKAAMAEAKARQEKSIQAKKNADNTISQSTVKDALKAYQNQLQEQMNAITGEKNSLSASDYENIGTIINKYGYKEYTDLMAFEIEGIDFRHWIEDINNGRGNSKKIGEDRVGKLKTMLGKFSDFLYAEHYITTSVHDEIGYALLEAEVRKIKKSKNEEKHPELYTYQDIVHLVDSFKKERFYNWFFYTYLLLGFFSAMRPAEMIALRWEDVDFRSCFITIKDAVTKRENKRNVEERGKQGHYKGKNRFSTRDIPMMNIYYFVLKDYREQYANKFKLKPGSKEFDKAFVFPAFQNLDIKKADKSIPVYRQFNNVKWINRQLESLCFRTKKRHEESNGELPEVKYIACKWLRHSGCTYLAKYLDYLETELSDYMGHSTRSEGAMVREIYAKLTPREKAYRARNRHPEVYIENSKYELERRIEKFDTVQELTKGDLRDNLIRENRAKSIYENIEYLYNVKKQRKYRYTADQDWIIRDWQSLNPDNTDMTFIEEERLPEDEIDFMSQIDVDAELEKYKNLQQSMIDNDLKAYEDPDSEGNERQG